MQLYDVNIVDAAGDAITRFALQLPTPKLMQLCLLTSRGAAETAELLRARCRRERGQLRPLRQGRAVAAAAAATAAERRQRRRTAAEAEASAP